MAIELPSDWPVRGWVEEPPLGHLETVPVDAPSGTVPTRWQVASWDTTREIASSSLPGQVRHQTGLSIGTGKALVKRGQDDHPWNRLAVFDLSGLHAQILIAPEGASGIPTGQFRVAPVEGDMTTLGVQVDLDERQIEGASKAANVVGFQWVSNQQIDDTLFDPVWLVEQLAQQMGYGVSVRPGEQLPDGTTYSPILDIPFQGSMLPEYPTDVDFTETSGMSAAWARIDRAVISGDEPPHPWSEPIVAMAPQEGNVSAQLEFPLGSTVVPDFTITADVVGQFRFEWESTTDAGNLRVQVENLGFVDPNTVYLQIFSVGSNGASNPVSSDTFNLPIPADRPFGVQVQVEVTATGSTWTSARGRIRRKGSEWSEWIDHVMTNSLSNNDAPYEVFIRTSDISPGDPLNHTGGRLSRFALTNTSSSDEALLGNIRGASGSIELEPLDGVMYSPWLDPGLTVWGALQEIVNAWQGALITDVYGNLRLMNRFTLTGVGTGVERSIDVGLNFEDLPWIMDYTDQADRLVVKYRPVVEKRWQGSPDVVPIVWEAVDRIQVPGGGSRDVFFSLEYTYPLDIESIPFIRKDSDNGVYHVWDAWRYSNGTGNHIDPGDEIAMRIDRVSSSTWKIVIRNLTADPWFYMVDSTATPFLKIRSTRILDQTAEQTITRGVSSGESTSALEIDLSNYVQNAEDANTLADFIWSRVNRRQWKAKTVTMVPDYRLDLGDVVELRHSRTRLRTNALVTKVDLAGAPGSVTQKVDLVLIPPTWEDFDEAWASYTPNPPGSWAEFDALWDTHTWAEFDLAPTATTEQQIQEYL